jgi:hypothetical protein
MPIYSCWAMDIVSLGNTERVAGHLEEAGGVQGFRRLLSVVRFAHGQQVLVPFDASKNATASALSENSWSNSNPSLYEKTPRRSCRPASAR